MKTRKYEIELAEEHPFTVHQIQVLREKVDQFLDADGISKNSHNRKILTKSMIEYCMKKQIDLGSIALTL